jgi:SsrA-binding protein
MAQTKKTNTSMNGKTVAENRKARFAYEVQDTYETGLVLTGTEVKSLRQGQANIQESYASVEGGELWLINSYLPEYLQGNRFNHEPRRRRKLLVKRKELARMAQAVDREGMTMVPLKIFFNEKGRAKLLLGVARGKKLHDKRETEKQRDWSREKARLMKSHG